MKLNAKEFGKIFAEPNRPKPAEPRTEPNRNFGRFRGLTFRNKPKNILYCKICLEKLIFEKNSEKSRGRFF